MRKGGSPGRRRTFAKDEPLGGTCARVAASRAPQLRMQLSFGVTHMIAKRWRRRIYTARDLGRPRRVACHSGARARGAFWVPLGPSARGFCPRRGAHALERHQRGQHSACVGAFVRARGGGGGASFPRGSGRACFLFLLLRRCCARMTHGAARCGARGGAQCHANACCSCTGR